MQNFAKTLRCLFVEGWITVDPRSSPSASTGAAGVVGDESAPPKTVTQIIFEQLEDMTYIRYGTQSKAFWKPTSKDECAAALADMASIAEDTLHRLEADFAGLYMDLEALNTRAWRTTQREKHARLMQAARHLCEAFNSVHLGSVGSYCEMGQTRSQPQRRRRHRGQSHFVGGCPRRIAGD